MLASYSEYDIPTRVDVGAQSEESIMAQQFADKFATTGSYRTRYIEAGSGEPLLLIHGGGAGADSQGNWGESISLFAEAGFRAIAYDMVGFGKSDAPDPETFAYSQSDRIDQLIAFIEALGFDKVSVIGNSMGGATGLGVAMRRPKLLKKLVLMGSAGLSHQTGGPLSAMINYDFTVEGMERIVTALTHPGFALSPERVAYRHQLSINPGVRKAYSAITGWVKQNGGLHYDESDIAPVKTEILVVNGKDDKVVPIDQGYRFLELLENSSGYFIPHCGHWAMIEHPVLFAEIATQFLKRA
jgi:pimeloyl-ACP methyl ester carboxylesterase